MQVVDERLKQRPKKSFATVVGQIARIDMHRPTKGDAFAVVSVFRGRGLDNVDVVVHDPKILKSLGIGGSVPLGVPQHGRAARFDCLEINGMRMALSMGAPPILPLTSATDLRAEGAGLIPAIARITSRLKLAELVGITAGLARHVPSMRRSAERVEAAHREYVAVRERKLGADSERYAMNRVLRFTVEAMESPANGAGVKHVRQMTRVREEARRTMQGLHQSLIEAHNENLRDISRSAALRELLPSDPEARVQASALVAWAAHQTIKAENPGGVHDGALEAIKECLIRSHSTSNGKAEVEKALRHASRALAVVLQDVHRNEIRANAINMARRNVDTAIEWIGGKVAEYDPAEETRKRVLHNNAEAALMGVIEEMRESGNPVTEVKRYSGGILSTSFKGGETAYLLKDGIIRVVDANGRLARLHVPGKPPKRFVDGVPVADNMASMAFGDAAAPAPLETLAPGMH